MNLLKVGQTTWNFKSIFGSDDDPQIEESRKELLKKSYAFIDRWKDHQDYLESPKVLTEALNEYEDWARNFGIYGKEGYYFTLRLEQETTNPKLKAKYNKIQEVGIKIANDIQFFTHRLAKVSLEKQKEFLAFAGLKPYKHFLEGLFENAKYLLSEPEEKILNVLQTTAFSNWVRMTSEFLSKEERDVLNEDEKVEKLPYSKIQSLATSKKKKVRDEAAKTINEILEKHSDTAEAEINSILATKKAVDELKNISRPDLGRHASDDIDTEVVDALLDSVKNRFDISKKYYALKTKLFGVEKLEYYEKSVEYGNIDEKYSYEKGINLVYKVFKNLDSEFADILESFVENGQIDVYPKKGKGGGAFCTSDLMNLPIYILLNYSDKLNDVLTVAHEMGHAINDTLMKKQNSLNYGSSLSTAEVASTFMEDFVLEEILKEANDELKLVIVMMKLDSDISSICRQVACYLFEQELHKSFRGRGYLSKEEIGKIFLKHMGEYLGDSIDISEAGNWWVYWSHIRSFFYVYSYASGLLISKSLQNFVKKDHTFVNKVKEFLSTGSSDSPYNIFLKLGIDIKDKTFWDLGLLETEELLARAGELAKKLGKI